MLTLSACVWKRGEEMAGFNARTGLEELEEYAVEHVAADIIVNANESNYNLPRPIEQL